MKHPPSPKPLGATISRLADVMAHIERYAFHGVKHLALDAGVSRSTVSRIMWGICNPTQAIMTRVIAALEFQLQRHIDTRDVFAENGQFLTNSVCDLVGCPGCLPSNALDEFGKVTPTFAGIAPGTWVTSRHPLGFNLPNQEL